MKAVEQLQKQIDFLHSLLNDEQDELYPASPPPPPTPVDHTAGRSGELVARYSSGLDVLETPHHSINFEERINESFRKNLQAFLKAADLLDKNGHLISYSNEQLRQHFHDWMSEYKTRRRQDFPFQQYEKQQDNHVDTQEQLQTLTQTLSQTQSVQRVATAQAFKATYDELHKFREFPRVPDLRRKLDWPREVFDDMVRNLRDSGTVQLEHADESIMTQDEILDCFVSEKNRIRMGIGNDRGTPSVSIPFSSTQNIPSQANPQLG